MITSEDMYIIPNGGEKDFSIEYSERSVAVNLPSEDNFQPMLFILRTLLYQRPGQICTTKKLDRKVKNNEILNPGQKSFFENPNKI